MLSKEEFMRLEDSDISLFNVIRVISRGIDDFVENSSEQRYYKNDGVFHYFGTTYVIGKGKKQEWHPIDFGMIKRFYSAKVTAAIFYLCNFDFEEDIETEKISPEFESASGFLG